MTLADLRRHRGADPDWTCPGNCGELPVMNFPTGESKVIGHFPNSGLESFSTPVGWEDALLILEPSRR